MFSTRNKAEAGSMSVPPRVTALNKATTRMRIALAGTVIVVVGVFASSAAAGVTFSDGQWVESAATCSYWSSSRGYVTAYQGATYTSTSGIYEKSRIWKWQNGRWVVWQNFQANWYPLASGLNVGDLWNNWLDKGQFYFEMLYGKYVRGKWETKSSNLKFANFQDNSLAWLDAYKLIQIPANNFICDTRYPEMEIINPPR